MLVEFGQRDTHDTVVVAVDFLDVATAVALDAVGTGFVKGFSGVEIIVDFRIGHRMEGDIGEVVKGLDFIATHHGASRQDAVRVVRQTAEHLKRIGAVTRFPKGFVIVDDECVEPQNDAIGMIVRNVRRFLFRQIHHDLFEGNARFDDFLDITWFDDKLDVKQSQQFATSR